MRFSVYTVDVGPSNNLALVVGAAEKRGHTVTAVLKEQIAPAYISKLLVPKPDAILIGLSSYKNEEEIALGLMARDRGIPWVILADTHRAWGRPVASGRIGTARLLIAAEAEFEEAVRFGYQREKIFYLGGPPAWQDFWTVKPVALPSEKPIVYVGGFKSVPLMNEFLTVVAEGAKLALGANFSLIFRTHPYEDGKPKEMAVTTWSRQRFGALQKAAEFSRELGGIDLLDIDEKLSSAAIAISATYPFFSSGATDTIVSAMHRHWVGYYESPGIRARVLEQTGFEEWYPAEKRAVIKVSTPNDVAREIRAAEQGGPPSSLKDYQSRLYPVAKKPRTRRIEEEIVDLLENPAFIRRPALA